MYFDNAATTLPKPSGVTQAMLDALNSFGGAGRSAHSASMLATRTLTHAREALAELFRAPDAARVILTANATHALNLAISGIAGHIVLSAAEHTSSLRPAHRRGDYTVAGCDGLGRVTVAAIAEALRPDTQAVILSHASNLTGNVFDIQAVGELCRARGAHLIVDAAQTAGLLPVDMEDCHISALAFTGHKSLYGPQGTGGLCLSADFTPPPVLVGGSGSRTVSLAHPNEFPDALEAGTPNGHGVAGLLAGVRYVQALGIENLFARADALARRFLLGVRQIPSVTVYGDAGAAIRAPIVSLNLGEQDAGDVAYHLADTYGIAVRAGLHCAPLMHRALGTEHRGCLRFSFSHYNTESEIDQAVEALRRMA